MNTAHPIKKPGHKFYFSNKAPIITDTSEVTTKAIVSDNESEGRYTVLSDLWKVGFNVQTHFHKKHFETFYLLSGEAEWTVNGETHQMKAGDAVYIPANAPHSAKTLGEKSADFILIYSHGDYVDHLERQNEFTEEERQDQKIKEYLWKLNDFHLSENLVSTRGKNHKFYIKDKADIILDDSEVTARIIVGDNDSEGRYSIISGLWKPAFIVPLHYHKRHFEAFYLTSGAAEWTINGETHALEPGDAVYIPANTVHEARTLGETPAHFMLIYSPGDYESHLEREATYSEEKRNEPETKEYLRKLNDFHVP